MLRPIPSFRKEGHRLPIGRNLAVMLAVVGACAALAAPATASTQPAAGTFVEGPETIVSERQSGGNTIITLTRETVITGTYTGVGQVDQYVVIHSDGSFNFHQVITFTGIVCGQPGVLEIEVVGRGDFNENLLTGTYTVIGPTDVGRGNGRIVSQPGVGGTYEGQVHCD